MDIRHCEACGTVLDQHFLNSAINAENISVSISLGKKRPVQNPIPIILGIIIVQLVWMISFFAEIVANTGQEEAVSASGIISVKDVRAMRDSSEQLVRSSETRLKCSELLTPNSKLIEEFYGKSS